MPQCFQLTRKGEKEPTALVKVDEWLCAKLGVPCNPITWVRYWYDAIGLAIACGRDWNYCRQTFPGLTDIVDLLESEFTYDAWYSHK